MHAACSYGEGSQLLNVFCAIMYFLLYFLFPLILHVQLCISGLALCCHKNVSQKREFLHFKFGWKHKCIQRVHVLRDIHIVVFGLYTEEGNIITLCPLIVEEE